MALDLACSPRLGTLAYGSGVDIQTWHQTWHTTLDPEFWAGPRAGLAAASGAGLAPSCYQSLTSVKDFFLQAPLQIKVSTVCRGMLHTTNNQKLLEGVHQKLLN